MYNLAFINNLSIENLELLDAETLVSSECIKKIDEMSQDAQFDFEPGIARGFYEILSSLLAKYGAEIRNYPESFDRLRPILLRLFWKALPSMDGKVKKQMLGEVVVSALKQGEDVKSALQKQLVIHEYGALTDKQQRRDLSFALENNIEQLGKEFITLDNKEKVKPTIQNWLKSYNSSQSLVNERGKFNQINYLNQDSNAKLLSQEDKDVLSKVLEIYDWLLFPPPAADVITASVKEPKSSYMKAQKFTMPPFAGAAEDKPEPVAAVPKEERRPPVVPRSPGAGISMQMEEIKKPEETLPRELETDKPANPLVQPLKPVGKSAEKVFDLPARGLNIQDILSKKQNAEDGQSGLKLSSSEQPLPGRQPEADFVDINQRLEKLRAKTKPKDSN